MSRRPSQRLCFVIINKQDPLLLTWHLSCSIHSLSLSTFIFLCFNYMLSSCYFFFIHVGIRVNLHVPRLILQILKLIIM
jgi:hypothetical protein